jgi:hypothetical protein
MKKINVIILLATISISASSYGQDTLSISKANLLAKKSPIKIYKLRLQTKSKSAQADHRQSNSLFLPSITASAYGYCHSIILLMGLNWISDTILDFNPEILNNQIETLPQNWSSAAHHQCRWLYGNIAARAKMNAWVGERNAQKNT